MYVSAATGGIADAMDEHATVDMRGQDMDERFDQLAKGLSGSSGGTMAEGSGSSSTDLSKVFGDAVKDDTVTEDGILYAKVVCHDQKKRGGSLTDALAFVDMWHERFGRNNFYGSSLETMKLLVIEYWDSVTCPDSELESQYYDMVTRFYF